MFLQPIQELEELERENPYKHMRREGQPTTPTEDKRKSFLNQEEPTPGIDQQSMAAAISLP